MTKPLKVTALLPAYNAQGFIQATLVSLSAQSYPGFNVIVSVDFCEDDTYEICLKHSRRDPRFRVFRQERRLGYVGNCNFLLDRAEADAVLFAFHDDLLAPECVVKLARALDGRPEAVLSFSDMKVTDLDGTATDAVFTALEGERERLSRGLMMLRRPRNWWVPNRGLFRLAPARRIQGLKTHGAGEFSVDFPWLFHMSLLGEFVRVPETLFYKHYQPQSLTKTWAFSPQQFFEVTRSCLREVWISELSVPEKIRLAVALIPSLLRFQGRNLRAALGRSSFLRRSRRFMLRR